MFMPGWLPLLLCSLGLLLLPAGTQLTISRELYVKPTEDTPCPEPCHTLDEYVQNATQYFVSNTTFNFLPGNHSLGQPLNVTGVTNLALVTINSTTSIICHDTSFVYFKEISNLTLENMTLFSCNSLLLSDLLDLSLLRINIRGISTCLNGTNILGTSILIIIYSACVSLRYNDHPVWSLPAQSQVIVQDSTFGTMRVFFRQSIYQVSFLANNFTSIDYGLPEVLAIHFDSVTPNNVTLINLHKFDHTISNSISFYDSGVVQKSCNLVYIGNCNTSWSLNLSQSWSLQVLIKNSIFQRVSGGTLWVTDRGSSSFVLRNVSFFHTRTHLGCDQSLSRSGFVIWLENVTDVSFNNCTFLMNEVSWCIFETRSAVVQLVNSMNVTFTNCTFKNNEGAPIDSVDSTFTLSGSNTFQGNMAYQGGAMALYGQSYAMLVNDSITRFVNNSARSVGGAIHIDKYYGMSGPCFFQFQSEYICSPTSALSVKLLFDNNYAKDGGDIIYGALFDTCTVGTNPKFSCGGWKFVNSVFHLNQKNNLIQSAISSDPLRVCLCDTQNDSSLCTTVFDNRTIYPGEMFMISAVVVGDRFGTVDGSVYAQLLPLGGTGEVAELGSLQYLQLVEHYKCNINNTYTVLTNSSSVTLVLTASSTLIRQYPSPNGIQYIKDDINNFEESGKIGFLLGSFPIYINITLLPCPLGFMLSGEPYQCICDTRLQDNHIPCNLTTQTFQRSGTEWVNASFHNNMSNGVIVNKHCPNNYCKPETVNISLEHPDTQCAYNHSGILCGGCQTGLSLVLGSAQCLSCSNNYLALLIPFALAGFALVFFIKLLNLTVATGTLNGLIFYANIVRAYQVAWIPGQDNILTVFIAWFNLDLGIETCFFDGLDAYWKVWLNICFVLYLLAIMILISVLCRYYTIVTKIFGRNLVQVLATLFLLLYLKLFRIVMPIIQASTLGYPDGTSATVWSYDGNIPYLGPRHAPLFVVALAIILFLWLPYTGILCFAQCLQRIPSKKITCIHVKLKPFLDAYYGPFKDNHRYWVGLLLLVRSALFVSLSALQSEAMLYLVTTVLGLVIYLGLFSQVYRNKYLGFLENSFLLNIGILAGGSLHYSASRGSQTALAYTSVVVAFAEFVAIVAYHTAIALQQFKARLADKTHRLRVTAPNQPPAADVAINGNSNNYSAANVINRGEAHELVMSYDDYREPILKYVNPEN